MAQTAIPTLFVETLQPNSSFVEGFVGTYDSSGNLFPEKNAYIYIYLDGFLVNPPEIDSNGAIVSGPLTVFTDNDGYWQTNHIYFGKYSFFQSGQVITLKAKTPGKSVSERSIPYVIGGTPTPINLGIVDEFGNLRPPVDGESSIYGHVSYWFNFKTGLPNFNCQNRLFIYLDGVKKGEVLKNNIQGLNAVYPITSSGLGSLTFDLLVDDNIVSVPLSDLASSDVVPFVEEIDGVVSIFTINLPTTDVGFKIYKNGIRLQEVTDYLVTIDYVLKQATINFGVIPTILDSIECLLQFDPEDIILQEQPSGTQNSINTIFTLAHNALDNEIIFFKNGKRETLGTDYTFTGNTITTIVPPASNDVLLVDYQKNIPSRKLLYTVTVNGTIDGINQIFTFNRPFFTGSALVYKNGIKLIDGQDFTFLDSTTIAFGKVQVGLNPLGGPLYVLYPEVKANDILAIDFGSEFLSLDILIDNLNKSQVFNDNCLTASKYQTGSNTITGILEGPINNENQVFNLPPSTFNSIAKIFKNGRRLVEKVDYIFDPITETITFIVAPLTSDNLQAVYEYNTVDVVVGERPTKQASSPLVGYTPFRLIQNSRVSTVAVYKNGIRLYPFTTPDYLLFSNTVYIPNGSLGPNDVILVDYQPQYTSTQLIYSQIPTGAIDGVNKDFTITPLANQNFTLGVFLDGIRQTEGREITFVNNVISFINAPAFSSKIVVDLYVTVFNINTGTTQLQITSPYTLDLAPITPQRDLVYSSVFGTKTQLSPGRDSDGTFLFFFNRKSSHWKYTNRDIAGNIVPFIKGQHIQAVALNEQPLSG